MKRLGSTTTLLPSFINILRLIYFNESENIHNFIYNCFICLLLYHIFNKQNKVIFYHIFYWNNAEFACAIKNRSLFNIPMGAAKCKFGMSKHNWPLFLSCVTNFNPPPPSFNYFKSFDAPLFPLIIVERLLISYVAISSFYDKDSSS